MNYTMFMPKMLLDASRDTGVNGDSMEVGEKEAVVIDDRSKNSSHTSMHATQVNCNRVFQKNAKSYDKQLSHQGT